MKLCKRVMEVEVCLVVMSAPYGLPTNETSRMTLPCELYRLHEQ